METFLGFISHPLFLASVAVCAFLLVVWLALPFAVYGVRHRLDMMVERLEAIQGLLEVREDMGSGRVKEDTQVLYSAVRGALLQFAPFLGERLLDPLNSVFFACESGRELGPVVFVTRGERAVDLLFPLATLERLFPHFRAEGFRKYFVEAFLPGKNGCSTVEEPDGTVFRVRLEPKASDFLDALAGVLREHLIAPLEGGV